jgi:hypothetical protein
MANATFFEINVAKKDGEYSNGETMYKHYFATAERSITSDEKIKEVYAHFKTIFPKPEYNITVTYYSGCGKRVNPEEF